MFDTTLIHFQSVFAHNFFVGPADRNYFLARFARAYQMNEEFYWQSLQAIEKYLKAGLVLNGQPVKKGFSHNIEKLWECHKIVFDRSAVTMLAKPIRLNERFWRDKPLEEFVKKVNRMGHPDGRYGLLSYFNSPDDIFKLDQLVFELRRRTIGLDWEIGKDWDVEEELSEFVGKKYQYLIEEKPSYQVRKVKLPELRFDRVGESLQDVWYRWNLAFTRNSHDIERCAPASIAPSFAGFGNSYLSLLWESLRDPKTTATPAVIDCVNWLVEYINIGKGAEKEILSRLRDLQSHP